MQQDLALLCFAHFSDFLPTRYGVFLFNQHLAVMRINRYQLCTVADDNHIAITAQSVTDENHLARAVNTVYPRIQKGQEEAGMQF